VVGVGDGESCVDVLGVVGAALLLRSLRCRRRLRLRGGRGGGQRQRAERNNGKESGYGRFS
jgi:hypothetical protein